MNWVDDDINDNNSLSTDYNCIVKCQIDHRRKYSFKELHVRFSKVPFEGIIVLLKEDLGGLACNLYKERGGCYLFSEDEDDLDGLACISV